MVYAITTDVPVSRTQSQLVQLLKDRMATQVAMGWSDEAGQIGFQMRGRVYKITVPIPATGATINGRNYTKDQVERSRWRTLLLVVKAKLESVDAGISTVEQEFLAWTQLPDGQSVYGATQATIEAAYGRGMVGPLLQLE